MSGFDNAGIIALTTFREAVRGKILLSSAFLAVALVIVALCFGMVTIGDQSRIVKDFGLFAVSIASLGYASISGAAFLEKELSRKTIYNVLSKAVDRRQFILGKFFGMFLTAGTLALLVGCVVFVLAWLVEGRSDLLIFVAIAYSLLELLVVCAAAVFFSTIVVTPVLGGFFTAAVFIAGRSADHLLYFVQKADAPPALQLLLKGLYYTLPNFAQMNVANTIVFGDVPTMSHFFLATLYSLAYSSLLIICACILFERRDFN